jgi:hypothetical protein
MPAIGSTLFLASGKVRCLWHERFGFGSLETAAPWEVRAFDLLSMSFTPTPAAMHHGPVSPEIAQGLLALRRRIEAARIPPSKPDESINVAVWNVREFGKARRSEAACSRLAA